jgi:hypothetical protein
MCTVSSRRTMAPDRWVRGLDLPGARWGDGVRERVGDGIPGAKPLNNCRWVLWRRDGKGWERVSPSTRRDGRERRWSVSATVRCGCRPTRRCNHRTRRRRPGAARGAAVPGRRATLGPGADGAGLGGAPAFSEHSYRSFAADGAARTDPFSRTSTTPTRNGRFGMPTGGGRRRGS